MNFFAPLTGAIASIQYPGCWIRDHAATQNLQFSAQDAANVAVHNAPILDQIDAVNATQEDLRKRLTQLQTERYAFPTLIETERFMCRRSAGCDAERIGVDTMISSPVLASRKSLQMVDIALARTREDLSDLNNTRLTMLGNLQETHTATKRLQRFSEMPRGCQAVLSTHRIRNGAAALGISIAY